MPGAAGRDAPCGETAADAALVGAGAGKAVTVDVSVTAVHYKHPVASLLVGDANRVTTDVVVRGADGAGVAAFQQQVVVDAVVNGIVGAAMAGSQDDAAVDDRLATTYATTLRRRIYGDKDAQKPAAKAAPAPATAPAAAGVPVS